MSIYCSDGVWPLDELVEGLMFTHGLGQKRLNIDDKLQEIWRAFLNAGVKVWNKYEQNAQTEQYKEVLF